MTGGPSVFEDDDDDVVLTIGEPRTALIAAILAAISALF